MTDSMRRSVDCFKCEKTKEEVLLLRESLKSMKARLDLFERHLKQGMMPSIPSTATNTMHTCTTKTPPKKANLPPTPAKANTPLKSKAFANHPEEECSVCLIPLEPVGRALFRTSCGHVFHFQCVKECVLTNQSGCPLCRKSFK